MKRAIVAVMLTVSALSAVAADVSVGFVSPGGKQVDVFADGQRTVDPYTDGQVDAFVSPSGVQRDSFSDGK